MRGISMGSWAQFRVIWPRMEVVQRQTNGLLGASKSLSYCFAAACIIYVREQNKMIGSVPVVCGSKWN